MSISEGTRTEPERELEKRPLEGSLLSSQLEETPAVGQVLDSLPAEWHVIHSRHWPGRSHDTIDHLAVGPTGIFVVHGAAWSGPVLLTEDLLEVNGRNRMATVQTTHNSAREVALLLPPHLRDLCFPVICFRRTETISGWVKAVRVCSTSTLHDLLDSRDRVLGTDEIARIAAGLADALPSAQQTLTERLRVSDQTIPASAPVPRVEPAPRRRLLFRRHRTS